MKNRIRRLIPDNRWDMGMMENWLEDMAAEGWLLEKCGGHFATFERWEPRPCRFRLEPLGGRRQDQQEARRSSMPSWAGGACALWESL